MEKLNPLRPDQLYRECDLSGLEFTTTAELEPLTETVGQERVSESLDFGVGIEHEGYNLYVMGSAGVGRHRVTIDALKRLTQESGKRSVDWCYLANFDTPHRPIAISLPPGMGRELRSDMQELVVELLSAIPSSFESEHFQRRAAAIHDSIKSREQEAVELFSEKSRQQSVALLHTPDGYTLAPIVDDKVLSSKQFAKLPKKQRKVLQAKIDQFRDQLRQVLGQIPMWQRELRSRYKELELEVVGLVIDQLIGELASKYAEQHELLSYFERLHRDLLQQIELFSGTDEESESPPGADAPRFNRYKVNLLVDNRDGPAVPILHETNPTYQNLLGRIEHMARLGTIATDFTLIKAGALHRANDGFLLLEAEKLLANPYAWEALKRTLKSREIRIESLERQLSLVSTTSLEPEPIPIDLKVILIGDRHIYHLLKAYDAEFSQLFRVVADFAETLPRQPGNDQRFLRLVATLQQREGLRPIERMAAARIVEWAARRAGDGARLSLHMGSLVDLLQEADYWSAREQKEQIGVAQLEHAIEHQQRRVGQLQERMQQEILDGILMIDTGGIQLGRVNGLSVIQVGDYSFGMPNRISATARIGSGEVIDIEREVDMGGPIHSKGVFILSAYLNRRYARYQPLSVSATLVFEQNYGEVEGDSASAGELCALLSALGDLPLKQSLAITGSVNQHGEMQPIGGVCEKIEGFFDICQARGLDGSHGVIIPQVNLSDLMLKKSLREAAAEGLFSIYVVRHVEQAMELFTGMLAGVADEQGVYPKQTVNGKVQVRLAEWFALRLQLSGGQG
ncbi:Lon protease family protein [endosymbiont of Ridgeia piscesae]|jgi:lon-related putative ATP-dependent protease|uniref:endopeptidase La n=1 Tax=endosymbiont of Ridgeia piscesae TaxID=54398 RepID=A0A0T5ZCJ2_9GAMM|nr:ATP-binding protein [endosymbiont of Ridgeia piscesae]KRT53611.1 putative ATP-dependent protease [endosymbiont of Ridgeia piscesae]KRT60286.1 lon-related putative ATP-dependent protease [endosymbiont of Ridgeia piscesae]